MPDLGFMELPTGRAGRMRVHHFHKAVSTLEFFRHSFSARENDEESCGIRFTPWAVLPLMVLLLTVSVPWLATPPPLDSQPRPVQYAPLPFRVLLLIVRVPPFQIPPPLIRAPELPRKFVLFPPSLF